jgi:hypothetical protein
MSGAGYYTSVCLNRHVRTDNELLDKPMYCEKCGAQYIQHCPACQEVVFYHDPDDFVIRSAYAPSYCKHCGKPYPWTQTALDTAKEYIEEADELSNDDKFKLIQVLPDIIAETPKTNLAVSRMQKALKVGGKFAAEGLRKFLLDFATELVKNQLGIK